MTFETDVDKARELRAIDRYVKLFNGSYEKLSSSDIDFKFFDRNNDVLGYAEVKGRIRFMNDAYPLPVSVAKLVKLMNKRLNPVIIWACEDGIIYGKLEQLRGEITYGGRTDRVGVAKDLELMAYFDKQKALKYLRY